MDASTTCRAFQMDKDRTILVALMQYDSIQCRLSECKSSKSVPVDSHSLKSHQGAHK